MGLSRGCIAARGARRFAVWAQSKLDVSLCLSGGVGVVIDLNS